MDDDSQDTDGTQNEGTGNQRKLPPPWPTGGKSPSVGPGRFRRQYTVAPKKGEGDKKSSGGGGGGGKGAGGYKGDPLRGEIEDKIRNQITGLLSGDIGSFTDEKVQLLKQQIQQTARAEEKRQISASNKDLIRRGIFRSGIAASANRKIGMATQRTITKAYNEVRMKQIEAEYTDKMNALQMGQKWLDSLRQYELGKEQIAATREATAARTSLGYAQIAAGERNAKRAAGAARASLGLAQSKFDWQMKMDSFYAGMAFDKAGGTGSAPPS